MSNDKRYHTQYKFNNFIARNRSFDVNGKDTHSTLVKKELEKLNMIKKHQIGEIRNLIEFEYFMNEIKKKNEQKEIEKEKKEDRLKKEKIRQQRIKEEKMKLKEEERIEKKKKEKEELNKKYRRKKN